MWELQWVEFLFKCEALKACPKSSFSYLLISGCCIEELARNDLTLKGEALASLASLELFPTLGRVLQGTLPVCCVHPCDPHLKSDLHLTMEWDSFFLFLVLKPYWALCPGGTSFLLPACRWSWSRISLFLILQQTAARFSRWLLRMANLHYVRSLCFDILALKPVLLWSHGEYCPCVLHRNAWY